MPTTTLTGSRIRERRLQAGMRQSDLARAAGMSASYLNLIEHNRRKVAPLALERIAAALGLAPQALMASDAADLVAELRAAAAGAGADDTVELDRAEEFAGRFSGWAGLVARQHRRVQQLEQAIEALSDRMTHDPHLSASLHEILSAATAVRSTAAILADTADIEAEWRARFERNLADDSARLAQGAEALVGYLDGVAAQETGIASPAEELEAWLERIGWAPAIGPEGRIDPDSVALAPELASAAARRLAQDWLAGYARDAAAIPAADLLAELARGGLDPGRLALRFGTDPATVFRRLAQVPLPVGPVGLVVCDGSGTLLLRKPLQGFPLPRFGAACPLWPLYQALARPAQPVRARVAMAGRAGAVFDSWAWCQTGYPDGFEAPAVLRAYMLIAPAEGGAAAQIDVGTTCRICPRPDCRARREPSIMGDGG